MTVVAIWIAALIVAVRLAERTARRTPRETGTTGLAVRAGLVLSGIRLPVFWVSSQWVSRESDFRQVIGYGLLVLVSLPEMIVARPWQKDLDVWPWIVSALIIVSSVVLGAVWAIAVRHYTARVERAG